MSRITTMSLAALVLLFAAPATAQTTPAPLRPGCAQEGSIVGCVTSSSIAFERDYKPAERDYWVVVSATVRIANAGEYPISIAYKSASAAMTPQNADTVTIWNETVSGLSSCSRASNCEYVTVSPGRAAMLQIRYDSKVGSSALPLMQIARTASLSASLYVSERGASQMVSLPLDDFAFGNGLVRTR